MNKMYGGYDSMMGIIERCSVCNHQIKPKNECICNEIPTKTTLKGFIVIPPPWWDKELQQWLEWIPWSEI